MRFVGVSCLLASAASAARVLLTSQHDTSLPVQNEIERAIELISDPTAKLDQTCPMEPLNTKTNVYDQEFAEFFIGSFDTNNDGTVDVKELIPFALLMNNMKGKKGFEKLAELRAYGSKTGEPIWFPETYQLILSGQNPVKDFSHDDFVAIMHAVGVKDCQKIEDLWDRADQNDDGTLTFEERETFFASFGKGQCDGEDCLAEVQWWDDFCAWVGHVVHEIAEDIEHTAEDVMELFEDNGETIMEKLGHIADDIGEIVGDVGEIASDVAHVVGKITTESSAELAAVGTAIATGDMVGVATSIGALINDIGDIDFSK